MKTLGHFLQSSYQEWYSLAITNTGQKIFLSLCIAWEILPCFVGVLYVLQLPISLFKGIDLYIPQSLYISSMRGLGLVTLFLSVFPFISIFLNREYVKRIAKNSLWHCFFLFILIYSFIATLLSDDPVGQLFMSEGEIEYYIYGACYISAIMIRDEKYRVLFLRLFSVFSTIECIIMICQEWGAPIISICFPYIMSASFFNANHLGYYLCMSSLCLCGLIIYDEKYRIISMLLFILHIYTLIENNTLGAYIGVLFAMPTIYVFFYKSVYCKRISKDGWIVAPAIGFVIVSLLEYMGLLPTTRVTMWNQNFYQLFSDIEAVAENPFEAGFAGSGRIELWIEALSMIKKRPFWGYGAEGLRGHYLFVTGLNKPHNEILQYAVFFGIPTAISYILGLIYLFKSRWMQLKSLSISTLVASGVIVGYFVSSMFGCIKFYTAPYFFIFLGFVSFATVDFLDISTFEKDYYNTIRSISTVNRIIYRVVTTLLMIVGIIVCILLGLRQIERSKEEFDLANMKLARSTAMLMLSQGILSEGEYWYDEQTMRIINSDSNRPAPYGKGTYKNGKSNVEYLDEISSYSKKNDNYEYNQFANVKRNIITLDYDTSSDYTNSIIRIYISHKPWDYNNKNVIVEWVE